MGRESLLEGQWQHAARQILATCQLLQALRDNVDVLGGDPLAASLAELYDYAGQKAGLAATDRSVTPLDEVWHLLKEVRTAWYALPAATRTKTPQTLDHSSDLESRPMFDGSDTVVLYNELAYEDVFPRQLATPDRHDGCDRRRQFRRA